MRRSRSTAVGPLLCALGLASGCFGDSKASCNNIPLTELPSPGAELKAVIFTRDCGATTAASTQVSILPISATLRAADGGNLFIADTGHGAAPAGPGGGPQVQVEWVGRNRLRLRHDHRARVFKAEPMVAGVRIEYVALVRRQPLEQREIPRILSHRIPATTASILARPTVTLPPS